MRVGGGELTVVPGGSKVGNTLSQACSHTPSGSEGHRVDKTTFKPKHGFNDTFSHTRTHTSEQVLKVTEWITAPCMTEALSLSLTHTTHTLTHLQALFLGGMHIAALVPTTIISSWLITR